MNICIYLYIYTSIYKIYINRHIIIEIDSQSCRTPLTDCFTPTGSSEGNLKQHTTLQKLFLYKCTTKI